MKIIPINIKLTGGYGCQKPVALFPSSECDFPKDTVANVYVRSIVQSPKVDASNPAYILQVGPTAYFTAGAVADPYGVPALTPKGAPGQLNQPITMFPGDEIICQLSHDGNLTLDIRIVLNDGRS